MSAELKDIKNSVAKFIQFLKTADRHSVKEDRKKAILKNDRLLGCYTVWLL
jgi:hypothetical protein